MLPLDATMEPPRCPPAALVRGEGSAREELERELSARGVLPGSVDGCPVVRVGLVEDPAGLRLEILDADGRSAYRTAPTVGVAASYVESWARGDLLGPLFAEREAAPVEEPPVVVDELRPAEEPLPFALRLALEPATAMGASVFFGVTAGACYRVGESCVGIDGALRLRPPLDEEPDAPTARRAEPELYDAELHLVAELVAARLQEVTLRPVFGLGIGRVWPGEAEDPRAPDVVTATTSPRVRVGLDADWALSDRVSLSAGAALELLLSVGEEAEREPDARTERERGGRQPVALAGLRLGARWGSP